MSDPLSDFRSFLEDVQANAQSGVERSNVITPEDQASTIQDVIANLGASQADVFAQLGTYLASLASGTGSPAPATRQEFKACVDNEEIDVSLPPQVGPQLPPIGKPDLEELFGAKATDPVDRFFINVAATVASIFSVFFGLGTIQGREVLQQYQATKPTVVLPPDLLADAVERNVDNFENAAGEALASGIDHTRFRTMVDLAGEPPGPVQAIELFRRGLISGERFTQMIAYSRIKTEYIPDLLQLAFQTMSGADAVNLYVKGIPVTAEDFARADLPAPTTTDPQELRNQFAAEMFKRAGGLPSQWHLLRDGAGDSVGVAHATALLDHGDITKEQWTEIVGRSRINPIFYYAAALSNRKWFSAFQIGAILQHDPSLADKATTWLIQGGYPADQVEAYVAAKAGTSTAKAKNATESAVIEQYEAGTLSEADASTELQALGYRPAAVEIILKAADARLNLAIQHSAISRVRSAYLAGHINLLQSRTELNTLGITPARIDLYLKAWQVEKDTELRQLTAGQIGSLARKGRINRDTAVAKWEAMGYSPEDADLLWQDYEPTAATLKHNVPAPGTPA